MLFKDIEGAAARAERVEREMDYVEAWTAPRACAKKAEKVLEQGPWGLEEGRGEEEEGEWQELHSKVSGELQEKTFPAQRISALIIHFHSQESPGR